MMQLLCEGLSVSEAAAELGFSDIKNVSRTFRQLKGITRRNTANRSPRKALAPSANRCPAPGIAHGDQNSGISAVFAEDLLSSGQINLQTESMSLKPLFLFACTLCALPLMAQKKNYTLTSPDGTLQATVATGSDLRISLSADGETLLARRPSR